MRLDAKKRIEKLESLLLPAPAGPLYELDQCFLPAVVVLKDNEKAPESKPGQQQFVIRVMSVRGEKARPVGATAPMTSDESDDAAIEAEIERLEKRKAEFKGGK